MRAWFSASSVRIDNTRGRHPPPPPFAASAWLPVGRRPAGSVAVAWERQSRDWRSAANTSRSVFVAQPLVAARRRKIATRHHLSLCSPVFAVHSGLNLLPFSAPPRLCGNLAVASYTPHPPLLLPLLPRTHHPIRHEPIR